MVALASPTPCLPRLFNCKLVSRFAQQMHRYWPQVGCHNLIHPFRPLLKIHRDQHYLPSPLVLALVLAFVVTTMPVIDSGFRWSQFLHPRLMCLVWFSVGGSISNLLADRVGEPECSPQIKDAEDHSNHDQIPGSMSDRPGCKEDFSNTVQGSAKCHVLEHQ